VSWAISSTPFVTYEEGDYVFGRWFESNFGDQPALIRSVAHFSELEEVIDFVRRAEGISIVPRDSIEEARGRSEVDIIYAGARSRCLNQVFMVLRSGSTMREELKQLMATLRTKA
jgi:DNA-binding transcriptional LysR family regulator